MGIMTFSPCVFLTTHMLYETCSNSLRLQADAEGWAKQNPDAPNPFVLTPLPKDKPVKLVGRGSTDDKGPVTGWLNVLEVHKELSMDIPVNIRFLFEGMEEQASTGLEAWITKEVQNNPGGFFAGVKYVCVVSI